MLVNDLGATNVQYAVISDGQIILSGNAGVYSRTEDAPITADTMYGIGSSSKVFTAAAIMILEDRCQVELDAPVTTYIPEFTMADPRYRQITVRMPLNHSSGLMGSLAKLVVERVSGESYTDFIRRNIAAPLGMTNTATPQDNFDRNRLARTYVDRVGGHAAVDTLGAIGTGGVYSTAEDLCKFARVFMDDPGSASARSVLSAQSRAAMPPTLLGHSGLYGGGSSLVRVDIAADGSLTITTLGDDAPPAETLIYIGDGVFAAASGGKRVSFVTESNGHTYAKREVYINIPGLGHTVVTDYYMQKLAPVVLEESVQRAWSLRDGIAYYPVNEKFSSQAYTIPDAMIRISLSKEEPGYMRTLQIVDASTAMSPL
ncbi:MAG: serine hydrolase domain-containing protein [Clostridia bacterium]|nr:serine hydrolase domain-containing protein [Clostridia bacterium]